MNDDLIGGALGRAGILTMGGGIVTTLLLMLMPSQVEGAANAAKLKALIVGNDYCGQTSDTAGSACVYESLDDHYARRGECINTADEEERDACYREARRERTEALDECEEQFLAREEVCGMIGQERYDPDYEPESFEDPESIGNGPGDVAPNPYFPLVPGTRWVYESEDEVITVEVLEDSFEIDGVNCAVVRDVVFEKAENGENDEEAEPVEDTLDWYAQDKDGNVWYFGEISLNFEDGQIADIEGSWKTGEEGARPGILMPADPMPGDVYRQEFLLGDAEDMAEVISTMAAPDLGDDNVGDCSGGCLQSLEWTPLEADSFEHKFYQSGIGMIREVSLDDPENAVELVEFTSPMN